MDGPIPRDASVGPSRPAQTPPWVVVLSKAGIRTHAGLLKVSVALSLHLAINLLKRLNIAKKIEIFGSAIEAFGSAIAGFGSATATIGSAIAALPSAMAKPSRPPSLGGRSNRLEMAPQVFEKPGLPAGNGRSALSDPP